MVLKIDLRVEIAGRLAKGERLSTAVTVVAPHGRREPQARMVLFAWPGGGYSRQYFDLQLRDRRDYSQAEYHAGHGHVFVACDHIGVGESSLPEGAFNHAEIAAINAFTATEVLERLRDGTVDERLPPIDQPTTIGLGQSYGGLLLTILQAEHPTFDGVAMLGWSAVCTTVSTSQLSERELQSRMASNRGVDHPYRGVFHYHDVPDDIVTEDLTGYPERPDRPRPAWATAHMPGGPNLSPERGPLGPNVVVGEAAAIEVPVLVVNGEVDVCPNPRSEPAAYVSSADITTFVVPRSGHMHNFAGTRHLLWRRIESWAGGVAPTSAAT